MQWYYYQNAESLPFYFDDIIDWSWTPPYSYRLDLKIRFASEYWYNVFHLLCEALYYMKYHNMNDYDRSEWVNLAANYLSNLLKNWKVKVRIFSVYFNQKDADVPTYFIQPKDADTLVEAINHRWNTLKYRRILKEKKNTELWIQFPYSDQSSNPDEEEFWFYYYDGVSVSHPDDPFWDEVSQEDIKKQSHKERFHSVFISDNGNSSFKESAPKTIIRI